MPWLASQRRRATPWIWQLTGGACDKRLTRPFPLDCYLSDLRCPTVRVPPISKMPLALAPTGWRCRDPHMSIPMTNRPAHPVLNSVYLFGRLTNQSRTMRAVRQVLVDLAANTAMIVRRGDESNEYSYGFPTDNQRDPPTIATERFRSPSAPQPHLTGGPRQGDLSVETNDVGSHRRVRAAGAGSPGGTNQRQCRSDRRVVRIEPRRRSRARHRLRSPTIDSRPR